MEPSHTRRYSRQEIEVEAVKILHEFYSTEIEIPIAIGLITEKYELIESIFSIPLLEDKYNVAAVLLSKGKGLCDIAIDEETFDTHRFRANFSIAHELGHVVLHPKLYVDCDTVEKSILLSKRIEKSYKVIEREANNFAEAILIPRKTIFVHTSKIYEALVQEYGYESKIIASRVCSTLARHYQINLQPMSIRLERLGLSKKIKEALGYESPYLDP